MKEFADDGGIDGGIVDGGIVDAVMARFSL
jgi:hypothetical protein